jgi:TP901-1 family phage major tail protein
MAQINGKDVVLKLRENGTTGSYLNLVCETSNSMDATANVTTTVTKCSTLQAVAAPVYNFKVDAIVETAPGGSEVSYEQVLSWLNSNTKLDFKREYPSGGADFYQQGTCYISSLSDAAAAEGYMTFSIGFAVTGSLDIIP